MQDKYLLRSYPKLGGQSRITYAEAKLLKNIFGVTNFRGRSRINLRVLQNFTKKIDHRNDVICKKIIDSARSKKVQF